MPLALLIPLMIAAINLELMAAMRRSFELRFHMISAREQAIEGFCNAKIESSRFTINLMIFKQNHWVNACQDPQPNNHFRRWYVELMADFGELGRFRILKMHYLR